MAFDVFTSTSIWAEERELACWSEEITTSTNTVAKNDFGKQPLASVSESAPNDDGGGYIALYLARAQTAGRGRGTHSWMNANGALLSSWAFDLHASPQPILSPLAGLAVYEAAVLAFPSADFGLKAPNDLYIGSKKVAGLLIETVAMGDRVRCVVGLGLNVMTRPELETATSLSAHAPVNEDVWRAFLDSLSAGFERAVLAALTPELDASARERLLTALNRFPSLSEPILEINSRGELRSASRVWHWHEL